ncbi:hypothetical protein LCGC14_3077960, partial [marine sediment metagenome]
AMNHASDACVELEIETVEGRATVQVNRPHLPISGQ